jgi:hypothetical protein
MKFLLKIGTILMLFFGIIMCGVMTINMMQANEIEFDGSNRMWLVLSGYLIASGSMITHILKNATDNKEE